MMCAALYPCNIYYKDHLFALQQGDPCLGIVIAVTEREAAEKAKSQGLGTGRDVVACYVPKGMVAYRDVKTGRVSAKHDSNWPGFGIVWKPFGYYDDPGGSCRDKPDYLEIMRLTLISRIEAMEKAIEEYPWAHLKMRLRKAQVLLDVVIAESEQ